MTMTDLPLEPGHSGRKGGIEDRVIEVLRGLDYDRLDLIPDFIEVDGEVIPCYEIILYFGEDAISCLYRRDYLEANLDSFARAVKMETYLAYLKDKGLSRKSIQEAKSHILHFQEFGNDLVGYMVYLRLKGYTRETISAKNGAVKAYLRWESNERSCSSLA